MFIDLTKRVISMTSKMIPKTSTKTRRCVFAFAFESLNLSRCFCFLAPLPLHLSICRSTTYAIGATVIMCGSDFFSAIWRSIRINWYLCSLHANGAAINALFFNVINWNLHTTYEFLCWIQSDRLFGSRNCCWYHCLNIALPALCSTKEV